MTKGYIVSLYHEIRDPDKLKAYKEIAEPAALARGARFLTRGERVRATGIGKPLRSVIIEFPSYDEALAHYDSAVYKKALEALGESVVRDLRIIEGEEQS